MAYSGSGTQADPYVVDNWTDFLTVLNLSTARYVKWADSQNKVISETITISREQQWNIGDIDFNGWTLEDVQITKTYDSSRPQIITNITPAAITPKVYNLTIDKVSVNDPRHLLFSSGITFLNCFFNDITIQELYYNHPWWQNGGSNVAGGGQALSFQNCNLICCILYYHTKNANIIYPQGRFINCEIYADYKYTLDTDWVSPITGYPVHGLFYRGTRFDNCYIAGKVDVSGGIGAFDIVRAYNVTEKQTAGITANTTIFNIDTKVSEDCSVQQHHSTFYTSSSYKSFFVTNNGNNLNGYQSIDEVAKGLLSDLRNSDELHRENVQFVEDDDVRYPQYDSTNDIKDWTFRKNVNVNTGIVFLPFWKYPHGGQPPVPEGGDVYENPYVTVYDMETKQNQFDNHGLAVLRPTSGRMVEELNGEFSVTFQHPRDTEDKWQYILEMNVIKALGQLFVIQKVDEVQTGGSGYVSAYAEHITYTLNDKWLFPPVTIAGYNGQTLIDSIMAQATDLGYDWQTTYTFDVTTDLDAPVGFRDWYEMSDGVTPYEMLIGSNGFIAKIGGELYRDNFTMKINERMYGAKDNAFELEIGYNLTGIKRTVDLTTFCTYLRGYDVTDGSYDTWFAVGWDPSTLPRPYPREVVRSTNFYYEHPEYAEEGQLDRDTMNFFNQNCAPLVSYELNVVDLRRNPDYKMFTNNYRFKVGDKGRVWDERLQSWLELEITRTEKDIITGDCVKVVIGTQRSFTRPVGYTPTIARGIIIPSAYKIISGVPPLSFITAETKVQDWTITGNSNGVGQINYGTNLFSYLGFADGVLEVNRGTIVWDDTNEAFTITATGNDAYTYPYQASDMYAFAYKIPVEANTSYELSWSADSDKDGREFVFLNGSANQPPRANNSEAKSFIFTTANDTVEITVRFGVQTAGDSITYSNIKLRKVTYSIPVTITGHSPVHYIAGSDVYHTADNAAYRLPDETQTQSVTITLNAPLMEGETVTLEDTGVDIPTYIGQNVLDIDLENKPVVSITYKEG